MSPFIPFQVHVIPDMHKEKEKEAVLFKHEHLTMQDKIKHPLQQSSRCSLSRGWNVLPCEAPEEDIH